MEPSTRKSHKHLKFVILQHYEFIMQEIHLQRESQKDWTPAQLEQILRYFCVQEFRQLRTIKVGAPSRLCGSLLALSEIWKICSVLAMLSFSSS